jgi:putative transcriptional regulator
LKLFHTSDITFVINYIITFDVPILGKIMKPIHPDYQSFVREVRLQLAISQEDLARELGVSYATVNRWENGQAKPSKLARAQLDAFCKRMQVAGRLDLSEKSHG